MRPLPPRCVALLLSICFLLPLTDEAHGQAPPTGSGVTSAPTLIVLVRHAERDGPSASDPGLTDVGAERAHELGRLLSDAGITRIHASTTRRAHDTAEPLARILGLTIERYEPLALEELVLRLDQEPGRHLVVGHSNTVDELSVLFGGRSFGPMEEDWEYDRLYLLTPGTEGAWETVLLRFGPEVRRP